MATYFHGNPETQASAEGLQTFVLMNPTTYVQYSDSTPPAPPPPPPSNKHLDFLNSNSHLSPPAHQLSHAPPNTQQFVGIPLDPNFHDAYTLHGLFPRIHYNLYSPINDPASGARDTARAQQGLSLSLSSQQQPVYGWQAQAVSGEDMRVSGGSVSSGSGFTNNNGVSTMQGVLLSSKYLKAGQELLDEVVNVNNSGTAAGKSELLKKANGASSNNNNNNNKALGKSSGGDGSGGGDTAGGKRGPELTTAERQKIQMKKAKLISMLDEVEQRYRQYRHQMQILNSSFQQAAGIGSARTYTALALKAMSRHFRCLKDAITGQIKAANKSLGEEDSLGRKIEGSRLKFVDHYLRQLLTGMDPSSPIEKAAMLSSPEQQKPLQQQQEEYRWSLEQEDMVMGPAGKRLSVCSDILSTGPSSLVFPADAVADAFSVNRVNQSCRLGKQGDEPVDGLLPNRNVLMEILKRGGNENVSQTVRMDKPATGPLKSQKAKSSFKLYKKQNRSVFPIASQEMRLQSNSLSSLTSLTTKLGSSGMLDPNPAVTGASSWSPSSQGLVSISDQLTSKDGSQVQTSTNSPFDSTRREGNPVVFASGDKVSFTFGLGSRSRNENPKARWNKLRAVLKWWLVWKDVTAKRRRSIEQLNTLREQGNPSIFDLGKDGDCFVFSPNPSQSKTRKSRAGWCKLRAVIKWWSVWRIVSAKRPQNMQPQSSIQPSSIISSSTEGDSCSVFHLRTHSRNRKPKAGWCKLRAVLKWLSVWRNVGAKRQHCIQHQSSSWKQGNPSKLASGNEAVYITSSVQSQSVTGKSKAGWCKLRSVLAWWSCWRDVTVRRHRQMERWNSLLQQGNASFFSSANGWGSCVASHLSNCASGKPQAGWCKLRAVLKWWSIWRDVTAKRPQIRKYYPSSSTSSAQLGSTSIFSLDGKGHLGALSVCQGFGVLHKDKEAKWSKPVAIVEFATSQQLQWTENWGSTIGLAPIKMERDVPLELDMKNNASSKVTVPFDGGSSVLRSLQGKWIDFNSEEPSKWRGDVDELLECQNTLSFDHVSSLKSLGMKETQLDFDKLTEITSKCMKSSSKNTWNEVVHEEVIQEIQRLSRLTYPPKSLPAYCHPACLVELNLQRSNIQQLWAGKQPFVNLKSINLKHSKVTAIPDLSEAQKLKRLNLRGCKSLQSLPSMNDLKLLTTLILTDCSNLIEIPELSTSIQYLFLAGTAIEELPLSIGCLSDLIKLDLRNCSMLRSLPGSICELQHLEYLDIAGCTILLELLESISLP